MKTIFTPEEIKDFIMPLMHQLNGDAILYETMSPNDYHDLLPSQIFDLARFSGQIDGKFELLKKMSVFFELVDEKEIEK